MNKIKLAATAVIIAASFNGGAALAQAATCTITGTGPSSNNVCQFDSNNNVIYTCVNNTLVVNGTNQTATTGIVQAANNTHVGTVSSGSAINVGETTTNANATCVAAAPTPTPTPTPTPNPTPTPGSGSEGPTPAPRPPVVTSLPDTASGSSAVELAGLAATGSIVVALTAAGAIRAYRLRALKDLS
jgi:hypothetical protein